MISIKANDDRGKAFLDEMLTYEERNIKARRLFLQFIMSEFNINCWHIHDGWLNHNYMSGCDVLTKDTIQLTWIHEHVGYSHSVQVPIDKIIIVKESPDFIRHSKPFYLYIFDINVAITTFYSPKYDLNKQKVVKCIFKDGVYMIHKKPWWKLW